MRAVRYFEDGAVHEGTLVADAAGLRLLAGGAPVGTPRLDGLVTGRFTDHHVHLQLIDHSLLAGSRLGRVVDLGANVEVIRSLAVHFAGRTATSPGESTRSGGFSDDLPAKRTTSAAAVVVEYAGPFLTAVGGYPSDREWAPPGSVHEITDASDAASVVEALAAAGVCCLKTVGNSDAGPVLDDEMLRTLAALAAEHGLPLIAHAEGRGQAQRAAHLGVTRLAHSPFTERLEDDEIAEQAASVSWISTMAIHEGEHREIVIDNVRRFFAAGGAIVYGSDMGNGPTPVDLRGSEIDALREAGIDGIPLLRALAPADPLTEPQLLLLPDDDPAHARRLTPEDVT